MPYNMNKLSGTMKYGQKPSRTGFSVFFVVLNENRTALLPLPAALTQRDAFLFTTSSSVFLKVFKLYMNFS